MTKFYEIIFLDAYTLTWSGDDAVTFLAIALVLIMLLSLAITHFLTRPQKRAKGKIWIPTSTNIKTN